MHRRRAEAVLFAALCTVLSPAQEPSPERAADATAVRALAEQVFATRAASGAGAVAEAEVLRAQLAAWVERDYPAVFAVWERLPDGGARGTLAGVLHLAELAAATTILRGAVRAVDTDQAGVVDDHRVLIVFDDVTVVRASSRARESLEDGRLDLLRGSHRDAWLGRQLRGNLLRAAAAGERLWAFRERILRDADADPGDQSGLVLREWVALPPAAAGCVGRLSR
ncbi:MAG: hypothetical protein AB7O97_24140 [Planctomycetota bacterium]